MLPALHLRTDTTYSFRKRALQTIDVYLAFLLSLDDMMLATLMNHLSIPTSWKEKIPQHFRFSLARSFFLWQDLFLPPPLQPPPPPTTHIALNVRDKCHFLKPHKIKQR